MGMEEEHVKARIVRAAKKLTAQKGFEATTVREICAEACANLSLVSYYYGGKEHVYEAVLDAFIPIGEASRILEEMQLDPVEGVCTMVREIVLFRSADPEISRIIHQEMVRQTPRTALVQQRVTPAWKLIRGFLEKGREQGDFHFRSLDMTMVQLLGSVLFGDNRSGLTPIMAEEFPDTETQIEDVLTFILRGIGYTGDVRFAGEPILQRLKIGEASCCESAERSGQENPEAEE
ncbi:TetR family transcriptional regulator [Saccharibacillus qingshengii]|uniref:TetR family transcriptional regulator n=1 Tax=Saccharibacillus qingshengii TaxID=1763540 RepID=UPI0015523D13|nr:TetR family transcriptional regulator [Saccharibacillus qingshengii]